MKTVVTGGAGFLGSHLVDRLVAEGHKPIVIDHYRQDKLRFPNAKAKVYKMRFGDDAVGEVLEKERPDAVFHLAAQISVTYSVEHPIKDAQTNIMDALRLLDHAIKAGVGKMVFVSSGGAIYGDHPVTPTPEVMDAKPISPYGIHKQAFEHYLDGLQHRGDIDVSIVRPANFYGPRQQVKGGSGAVVPIFLSKIFNGEEALIFGEGASTRDYVYVKDGIDAFMKALQTSTHEPVNIATGEEVSILKLWEILSSIHDGETVKRHEPSRPGEIEKSCLHPGRAEKILGWRATTPLEQGLRETYDWFKKTYYDA